MLGVGICHFGLTDLARLDGLDEATYPDLMDQNSASPVQLAKENYVTGEKPRSMPLSRRPNRFFPSRIMGYDEYWTICCNYDCITEIYQGIMQQSRDRGGSCNGRLVTGDHAI
jgi:hypothetical protein